MDKKIKKIFNDITDKWWYMYVIAFFILAIIAYNIDIRLNLFDEDGKRNLWAEFHGVIFDLLLFAIILKGYERSKEKKETINRLFEELEDYKYWKGEESAYRRIGIINRLIREGVKIVNITHHTFKEGRFIDFNYDKLNINHSRFHDCILGKGTINNSQIHYTKFIEGEFQKISIFSKQLKALTFIKTKFYHTSFNNTPLPFSEFNNCWFNNTQFIDCELEDIEFNNCVFLSDISFTKCNLKNANFDGSMFFYVERLELIALFTEWIGEGPCNEYIVKQYSITNFGETTSFGIPEIFPIGQAPKTKFRKREERGCTLTKMKKSKFTPIPIFP